MIAERDKEILKSLTDVRCEHLNPVGSPNPSFRLTFYFDSNTFFRNTKLSKDYLYQLTYFSNLR